MELQSLPPTTAAVIVVAIAVTIVANAILYTVIATRVKLNIYFPSYQLWMQFMNEDGIFESTTSSSM